MLSTHPETMGSVAAGGLVLSWHHDSPARYGGPRFDLGKTSDARKGR